MEQNSSLANATRLIADAESLMRSRSYKTSIFLSIVAIEECAKAISDLENYELRNPVNHREKQKNAIYALKIKAAVEAVNEIIKDTGFELRSKKSLSAVQRRYFDENPQSHGPVPPNASEDLTLVIASRNPDHPAVILGELEKLGYLNDIKMHALYENADFININGVSVRFSREMSELFVFAAKEVISGCDEIASSFAEE